MRMLGYLFKGKGLCPPLQTSTYQTSLLPRLLQLLNQVLKLLSFQVTTSCKDKEAPSCQTLHSKFLPRSISTTAVFRPPERSHLGLNPQKIHDRAAVPSWERPTKGKGGCWGDECSRGKFAGQGLSLSLPSTPATHLLFVPSLEKERKKLARFGDNIETSHKL